MRRGTSWIVGAAVAALLAGACGSDSKGQAHGNPTAPITTTTLPDPASVKANELGVVPVLMYHRLTRTPSGEYDRTPDDFRAELQRLYDTGYRPVLARDLIAGTLDVPPGLTPVVLTFDDTTESQYALDAEGNVPTTTAVGILLEFGAAHPDFRPIGTMYVNRNPFKAGAGTAHLQDLARRGFELGAHTLTHQNLSQADDETVQKELVEGIRVITKALPDAKVATMALPFGKHAKDTSLEHSGTWDGQSYTFEGIFLVGSGPSPSPFAAAFDPLNVPRIRSGPSDPEKPNYGSEFWLDTLDKHPERRYVSDGNPQTVSFPKAEEPKLAAAAAPRARPY